MIKQFAIKPVLVAMLLAGSCAAHAAHLDYVSHLGFGGYSGASAGEYFSEDLLDLSAGGDVTLFGANPGYSSVLAGGSLNHGYAADGYYSNGNVMLSLTHFLNADTSGGMTVGSHQQSVLSSLASVTLKIASDGETNGSPVQVSFAGMADALHSSFAGVASYLQMDIAVFSNGNELGSFLWDASGLNAQQGLGFNFNANIGDELTFTATLAGGAMLENLVLAGGMSQELLASSGMLSGNFSVTAVPEPEQYAMFLAGLGLLGVAARRRKLS